MSRRIEAPSATEFRRTAGLTLLRDGVHSADRSLLRRLYDATASQVYARALRITGAPADAEQVTLDVYRHWRYAKLCSRSWGTALPSLMALTRVLALSCCQKRPDNALRAEGHAEQWSPESGGAIYGIESCWLRSALLKLEPRQARVLGLACYDALTVAEIAVCTRWPEATVREHLFSALSAVTREFINISGRDLTDEVSFDARYTTLRERS